MMITMHNKKNSSTSTSNNNIIIIIIIVIIIRRRISIPINILDELAIKNKEKVPKFPLS
jgi:hypothetical protein